MTPRDAVLLEYSNIPDGTTLSSQECPNCHGGTAGERSMSVGVADGLLWWRCHRASCEFKGGSRLGMQHSDEPRPTKKRTAYTYSRLPLPDAVTEMLATALHVPDDSFTDNGWMYTPDLQGHGPRVIMPIRNMHGRLRGYVYRSYWGASPKALTSYIEGNDGMAWHRVTQYGRKVVLVEDIPSAHRLMCSGVDAVALLGTNVTRERLTEVAQAGYSVPILSLDQDATDKAIRMAVQFPGLRVVTLDKDIKDMSDEQFEQYVNRVRAI